MDVDRRERQEEQRVELRGDGEAEGEGGESRPAVQERSDTGGGQRDGERVEPRQRELAEEQRCRADQRERRGRVAGVARSAATTGR